MPDGDVVTSSSPNPGWMSSEVGNGKFAWREQTITHFVELIEHVTTI